jgi:error-prone DNA polymerase
MRHLRATLTPNGVRTARELHTLGDGTAVAHAGLVICRQRPPTAKGFMFLTLEDETGTINVVVRPQQAEAEFTMLAEQPILLVRGVLQVEDGVWNIRAKTFLPLKAGAGEDFARGHDFH